MAIREIGETGIWRNGKLAKWEIGETGNLHLALQVKQFLPIHSKGTSPQRFRLKWFYTSIRTCCSRSAAPLLPLPLLSAVAASVSTVAGLAVEAVACSVSCLAVEVALQVGVASAVVAALVAGCSRDSSCSRQRAFSNTLYHRTGKCIVGALDDRTILFQL